MIPEPTSSLILNTPEAGLFLDVGCGECDFTNVLREDSRRIISLDVRKPQTPLASDNMFILGSIDSLPINDNVFDFIYCLSVLQLIQDDRAAIEEIFRILKPGGRFYLTIPTRRSAFRVIRDLEIRFGMYEHPQYNVKHHHYYSKRDIEILIQGLFQIESISGYGYNFIPRLLNFLLDLSTMRKYVVALNHSISIHKVGNESPHMRKTRARKCSGEKPHVKNEKYELLRSIYWPFYGLAYHYIVVLKK